MLSFFFTRMHTHAHTQAVATPSCTPVGATSVYLSDDIAPHLGGAIAFGGGRIARQEMQRAVGLGVKFKYGWIVSTSTRFPARSLLKPLATLRAVRYIACQAAKYAGGADPFGEIHVWAATVRHTVRAWRQAEAARVAAAGEDDVDVVSNNDSSTKHAAPAGAGGGAGAASSAAAPTGASSAAQDTGMCLTMHQPWASLLVYGIKRVEGRGWPTRYRGRLWIHAAAKQPDATETAEMEAWYRHVKPQPSPLRCGEE